MKAWLFFTSAFMLIAPGTVFGTSYPCEFGITSQTVHAIYNGQQRNNPDGTFYPGDAFNYIANYPGLGSCFQPVIYKPVNSEYLVLGQHTYEDEHSVKIFDDVSKSCRLDYCTAGHAEITVPAQIGIQDIKFSAGGWKVTCNIIDGEEYCTYDWVSRTSFLSIDVTDPKLTLHLEKKFMNDSNGYNATNADGTHYVWDPVIIQSIPSYNWKNERSKTLFVEYEKNTRLYATISNMCINPQCLLNFILEGFLPVTYNSTYGHDITIYNATDQHLLGNHDILHKVKLQSVSGKVITFKDAQITGLVVTYEPIFEVYPYLVLSDRKPTSWDNRHGIAMFYNGSIGSGPDDKSVVHENRRSKINNFSSVATAVNVNKIVPVDVKMVWSEAYGTNPENIGYCTNDHYDSNVLESKDSETAMFVSSGYGGIIFDLPISDIMKNPAYSRARVIGNIMSDGFAGNDSMKIINYEYAYPDVLFGNSISLVVIDSDGQILEDVPVSINVTPNLGMKGVSYTHDYVCDKSEFDTNGKEIGDLLLSHMYPKKAQNNAFGNVTLYLPRISTWNVFNMDDFFSMPINDGYAAPAPYIMRFSVGEKTITKIRSYSHIGDHTYVANQNTDNTLRIMDNKAGVTIIGPDGFGHIRHIRLGGADYSLHVNCLNSCIIPTPKNSVLIEAYNIWGGRAFALYEPGVVQKSDSYIPDFYSFAVIIVGAILAWRLIRWILNMWHIKYHNS